jgi:hypothetical protein
LYRVADNAKSDVLDGLERFLSRSPPRAPVRRITLFTDKVFVSTMPQSRKHIQAAGLLLRCIEDAIRQDLLGLDAGEEDPYKIWFEREGSKQLF